MAVKPPCGTPKKDRVQEIAYEKYGHSNLFATPESEEELKKKIAMFLNAMHPADRSGAITIIGMMQNCQAIVSAKRYIKMEKMMEEIIEL